MPGIVQTQSLPFSNMAIATYSGGRLAVPVSPSAAIYANFPHVIGVPSGSGGVSLDRAKLLDVLIDRLSEALKAASPASPAPSPRRPASAGPAELDALIEKYRKELVAAIDAARAKPYSSAPRVAEGMAFALSA